MSADFELTPNDPQPITLPNDNEPVIRQVSMIANNDNNANAQRRDLWLFQFNSFLKKKNFTCLYFAILEIIFMVVASNAFVNNTNWSYLLLTPTIDILINFIYIMYIAKEKNHCCQDKLCWNWFTNLCKIPVAIFAWSAANTAKNVICKKSKYQT